MKQGFFEHSGFVVLKGPFWGFQRPKVILSGITSTSSGRLCIVVAHNTVHQKCNTPYVVFYLKGQYDYFDSVCNCFDLVKKLLLLVLLDF